MQITRPASKQPIPKHAKKVFSGIIFDIYQWEQKMYDGSTATFEKAKRKCDSVGTIPITAEGKLILTKQEQPQEEPFIGIIGGRVDEGETPIECAKREMLEESGITAKKFELLYSIQPSIKVDWACYTFIAKDLTKKAEKELESGEKIDLIEVTFDEYMDVILQPNYRDQELTLFFLTAMKNPAKFETIREMFSHARR